MSDFKESITNCALCPRECGANRQIGEMGFCKVGAQPLVASIFLHRGEEPIISGQMGICNVFFAHCNLECIYCQNYQISSCDSFNPNWLQSYDDIIESIISILKLGVRHVGFVSPSHQVAQMVEIIHRIHQKGFHPTIVYNTNAYDKPEILRILSDLVDVYLPDIKYFSNEVANELSGIPNYFDVAILALREMIWQKGTSISLGDDGLIDSGVIIRHLVLPNHSDDSVLLLKALEEEFSNNLWISILSQYFPTDQVKEIKNLDSLLAKDEYLNVLDILYDLGFYRGFIQKLGSGSYYKPNFNGPVHFKK